MCDHLPTLNAGVQIPVNRPFSRLFMMQNGETTLNLQQTRNFFVVSFEISYLFPRLFGRTWSHMGDVKYPGHIISIFDAEISKFKSIMRLDSKTLCL